MCRVWVAPGWVTKRRSDRSRRLERRFWVCGLCAMCTEKEAQLPLAPSPAACGVLLLMRVYCVLMVSTRSMDQGDRPVSKSPFMRRPVFIGVGLQVGREVGDVVVVVLRVIVLRVIVLVDVVRIGDEVVGWVDVLVLVLALLLLVVFEEVDDDVKLSVVVDRIVDDTDPLLVNVDVGVELVKEVSVVVIVVVLGERVVDEEVVLRDVLFNDTVVVIVDNEEELVFELASELLVVVAEVSVLELVGEAVDVVEEFETGLDVIVNVSVEIEALVVDVEVVEADTEVVIVVKDKLVLELVCDVVDVVDKFELRLDERVIVSVEIEALVVDVDVVETDTEVVIVVKAKLVLELVCDAVEEFETGLDVTVNVSVVAVALKLGPVEVEVDGVSVVLELTLALIVVKPVVVNVREGETVGSDMIGSVQVGNTGWCGYERHENECHG